MAGDIEKPLDALFEVIARYQTYPRTDAERRDIAEHVIAAFIEFFSVTGLGTGPAVDSLAAVLAALNAVDRGEPHALITPEHPKRGRPATPLDGQITQDALKRATDYLMRTHGTEAAALRVLADDLRRHGLETTHDKLSDILESERTAAERQEYGGTQRIENDAEYQAMLAMLARALPTILQRIYRRTHR